MIIIIIKRGGDEMDANPSALERKGGVGRWEGARVT
jgi:hypothetical protein